MQICPGSLISPHTTAYGAGFRELPNPCRQGMERPIRDIQQHIDYVGTLAEEEPDPKTRWQLQKRVAASVWQRDAKAYYEEQGAGIL